jgi:hypothetical protein
MKHYLERFLEKGSLKKIGLEKVTNLNRLLHACLTISMRLYFF